MQLTFVISFISFQKTSSTREQGTTLNFIGTTRFSLYTPNSKSLRTSNSDKFSGDIGYYEYLYSPDRIEPRLHILEEYSLPQLSRAAAEFNLRHMIRYSAEMPNIYINKLESLSKKFPFIVLDENRGGKGTVNPYRMGFELSGGSEFGLFRLDDDDFLSADFFEQTSPYVSQPFAGMRVSLGQGFTGFFDGTSFSELHSVYRPYIAIGLMSIYALDGHGKMIFPPDVSHHHSDRVGPVIVDSSKPSYFWTRHVGQDTSFDAANIKKSIRNDMSKFDTVSDLSSVFQQFPVIRNAIKEPKITQLAKTIDIDFSGKKIEMPMASPGETLRFHLRCEYPQNMTNKNALISFHFFDPMGATVSSTSQDLSAFGIAASKNPQIGYYRYLKVAPGELETVEEVEIPEGLFLNSVSLRSFGNRELSFKVDSLAIESI